MQKNKRLKIITGLAIVVCALCLLIKSFVAIYCESELDGGAASIIFKINPLENNLVFADKDEANFFLHHPESYTGTYLDPIFMIPLPVYIFIFLLLIAVYAKLKNPMRKTKRLIVLTIAVPLLVWIIWLFQTYDPSQKGYSADGQYSYYFETYNFNKVKPISFFYTWDIGFAGVRPPSYYYKLKIFLYDEVEKRILTSRYFGDENDIANAKWGFSDWDSSAFYLTTGVEYKLPRPINPEAIEREQREENAIDDSENQYSSSCKILYSFYGSNINTQTDTIYFERNNKTALCFYNHHLYLDDKEILCFKNVAGFGEIVYLESDKRKYLYFYPSFFYDNAKSKIEEPEIIMVTHNCGVIVEFTADNQYVFKVMAPFFDALTYCNIPSNSTYEVWDSGKRNLWYDNSETKYKAL